MKNCNRANIIDLKDGYSLYLLGESSHAPTPRARSFELADDQVQYAPDRPADVKHVKLDITLDFEQETISGTVYTTFSTLYDDLKTITFDAVAHRARQIRAWQRAVLQRQREKTHRDARSCLQIC